MMFLRIKQDLNIVFGFEILGDHSRFIHDALAPVEKDEIQQASDIHSSI